MDEYSSSPLYARWTLGRLATGETYEDCEQPPEIAHGSARLTVDDNEEYVTAHYTCKSGYRLQEPQLATLRCSIETDEWEAAKLPACVQEILHTLQFIRIRIE
uniref:Sushi domain-containing protein n=1 Tax=Anopheles stephensi TaxID=30069 RepID=A0A182YD53_ANOST